MRIEFLGTFFFAIALLHSLLVSHFAELSHRYPKNSGRAAFFHLLGEVEIVFGFWAFIFLSSWAALEGPAPVIHYQQGLNLTEPLFIFCIMVVASTRPIISLARSAIVGLSNRMAKLLRLKPLVIQLSVLLTLGPVLGSVITEPAAITITALLLARMILPAINQKLLYRLLALLFVNVSIGGALTNFAAPPILMVARTWNWSSYEVFTRLGLASLVGVLINTLVFVFLNKNDIQEGLQPLEQDVVSMPIWVVVSHFSFLAAIVATAHYSQVFFSLFLIFMGLVSVTKAFNDQLKFRESFLVAFFLGGLVVFGSQQKWWLEPLLTSMGDSMLFFGATALTAVTDNAALTYLGTQVSSLSNSAQWALVAGALSGGGLTILANAPNPAGYSILSSKFPDSALSAIKLFQAAVLPTIVVVAIFCIRLFVLN